MATDLKHDVLVATRVTAQMYDELAKLAKENSWSVAAEILFAINAHILTQKESAIETKTLSRTLQLQIKNKIKTIIAGSPAEASAPRRDG